MLPPSIFNRHRPSSFFYIYMIHMVRAGLLMEYTKGGYLQNYPQACILSGTKAGCYKQEVDWLAAP